MRRPTRFALAWAVVLTLVVLGPTLYAALVPAPGMRFTGNLEFFYYDSNTYRAWIEEAREGWWLFADRYTTEPTSHCFFHPVFLLLGLILRATNMPVLALWVGARMLTAAAAVFCVYLFARRALGENRQAVVAMLLVTLGGGVGWLNEFLAEDLDSTDIWMPEVTFYQSLRWPFLWCVALMLMMAYFSQAARALGEERSRRAAVLAGLCFAGIVFAHPYHVLTFAVIPGAFLLIETWRLHRVDLEAVRNYVTIGAIAAPPAIYQVTVVRLDPVLSLHALADMSSPSIIWYVTGFGPVLLLLALFGLRRAWRSGALGRMLVVWLVGGMLLLYAPVAFNRRLVTGLMIPLGVVGSYAVEWLLGRVARAVPGRAGRLAARLALASLLLLIAPTNLIATREDWRAALAPAFPAYITDDTAEALAWLRGAPEGVVLAEFWDSNFVPAFAGQRVYAGHWAQTIDVGRKVGEVERFFGGSMSDDEARRFLVASATRYVVYGPRERDMSAGAFDPARFGAVRFRSGDVVVVEVGDYDPSAPSPADGPSE